MGISGGPDMIQDGLVLALDAADRNSYPGSGTTWRDVSGNGNNGTLTNGPTFSNNSIVFDGTNDYCQFSSLPPGFQSGMTNYSISIWFKLNTYKDSPLLEMGDTFGDLQRIMFWTTGESPNRLYALGASQNTQYRYSSVYLSLNTIYNAVYTYNNTGTISKLYINSIEDIGLTNSTVNGLLTSLSNTWTLGADSVYNHIYCQSANIYSVVLYTKTLSQIEIRQNYNAQKSRFNL
jgi:hypothetical protein